jgi:hypothetical protein
MKQRNYVQHEMNRKYILHTVGKSWVEINCTTQITTSIQLTLPLRSLRFSCSLRRFFGRRDRKEGAKHAEL